MALQIPSELEPLFQIYDIPWPDVDEDVFNELPGLLRNFGSDLLGVGDAIESALQDLAAGNPSHTLQTVQEYVGAIRRDFLDRVSDLCNDLAGTPCAVVYEMIVAAKWAAIAALACEVGDDVIDIASAIVTLGADSALAAAEAIAVREAISQSLQIAEAEIAGRLVSMANGYVDGFVNSIVQPFISFVSRSVENAVESYLPNVVLREVAALDTSALLLEDAAAGRLHLSPAELESSIGSIWNSSEHLGTAAQTLEGLVEQLFSHPAPNIPHIKSLSSDMRMALRQVALTIKNDLVAAVEQLVHAVEQHFVTLLEDYKRAIDELDEQGRAVVVQQHLSVGSDVVVFQVIGTGGAAAGLTFASGIINSEEAGSVDVSPAASAGADSASIGMRTDPNLVSTEPVSARISMEDLNVPVRPSIVKAAAASGDHIVQQLKVSTDSQGPHVVPVAGGSAESVSALRHDSSAEHVTSVPDGSPQHSPSGASELHLRDRGGERLKMGTSEAATKGLKDLRTENLAGTKRSDVDDVAVTAEMSDQ